MNEEKFSKIGMNFPRTIILFLLYWLFDANSLNAIHKDLLDFELQVRKLNKSPVQIPIGSAPTKELLTAIQSQKEKNLRYSKSRNIYFFGEIAEEKLQNSLEDVDQ